MGAQADPGAVSAALTRFATRASGAAHCHNGRPVLPRPIFPVHVVFSPARLHAAPVLFFPVRSGIPRTASCRAASLGDLS